MQIPFCAHVEWKRSESKKVDTEKKKNRSRFCYQHFSLFDIKRETFIAAILSNHLFCALAWLQVASLKQCSMLECSYNVPVPDTKWIFFCLFLCASTRRNICGNNTNADQTILLHQRYRQKLFFFLIETFNIKHEQHAKEIFFLSKK